MWSHASEATITRSRESIRRARVDATPIHDRACPYDGQSCRGRGLSVKSDTGTGFYSRTPDSGIV